MRATAGAFIILIIWFNEYHIIRPLYTTLQELISSALSAQRRRLKYMLTGSLDESACMVLFCLLKSDETLSQLSVLGQDEKNFGWRRMAGERERRTILELIYQIARTLLPQLVVSQQNLLYYANLANFYTVRYLKPCLVWIYLLCYTWLRYRQLSFYVDDRVTDLIPFWEVRKLLFFDEKGELTATLLYLLVKYGACADIRIVELLSKVSPIVWQHILLNSHYRFQVYMKSIVFEELISKIE